MAVILILVKEAKRGTLNKLQRWVKSRKRINKRLKRRSKYGKRN
jgi:hypothetical protein